MAKYSFNILVKVNDYWLLLIGQNDKAQLSNISQFQYSDKNPIQVQEIPCDHHYFNLMR